MCVCEDDLQADLLLCHIALPVGSIRRNRTPLSASGSRRDRVNGNTDSLAQWNSSSSQGLSMAFIALRGLPPASASHSAYSG